MSPEWQEGWLDFFLFFLILVYLGDGYGDLERGQMLEWAAMKRSGKKNRYFVSRGH